MFALAKMKKNNFDLGEILYLPASDENLTGSSRSHDKRKWKHEYLFLEQVIQVNFEFAPVIDRIVNGLDFLLGRILGLTPVHTPTAKRARISSQGDATLTVHYMATFR